MELSLYLSLQPSLQIVYLSGEKGSSRSQFEQIFSERCSIGSFLIENNCRAFLCDEIFAVLYSEKKKKSYHLGNFAPSS